MSRSFDYIDGTTDIVWVVPSHHPGSMRFRLYGAAGGSNGSSSTAGESGGPGGSIRGVLFGLTEGDVITLRFGGQGQPGYVAPPGVDWPYAVPGDGPRPGGHGGIYGSHAFASSTLARRTSGSGGGGSELWVNGVLVAVAGGGAGGAIHAGTGFTSAPGGAAQTGSGGQQGGASTSHPGGNNGNDGFGGTTSAPGLGGGSAAAKWPTYVEDGWPGVGGVGGDGASMIYVPGSAEGGSACGGGSGGGGGFYGGGGGGATYLLGTAGTGGGGSSWSDPAYVIEDADGISNSPISANGNATFFWRGIDGPNLGVCYAVGRNVTTSAASEVYLNNNATTAGLFTTKSVTPAGLPAGSTTLTGFQLHLSTVSVMSSGGPHLQVLDPTGSSGIAGTWSGPTGVVGGTGEITLDGWDYWVTDYLNFPTGAQSPDVVFTTLGATPGSTEFDIQIRCKAADWDAPVPGWGSNAGQLISQGAFGVYNVARGSTGMWLYARYNLSTSGQANTNITCPWGSLGFTDNAWEWLRVTADVANGIRWWVGGPGAWTVVQTDPYPVNWVSWNSATNVRIGNGLLASSALGRGFQGSISDATVSDVVDGAPILNINLVAMTSATDATWPNSGTYGGTWTKGTNVSATGSGLGSGNPTFLFTTPIALDQFAVFLDNTTAGSYRIDEWCLDYITDGGWSVGMILAN